jgi:hypothetical protein
MQQRVDADANRNAGAGPNDGEGQRHVEAGALGAVRDSTGHDRRAKDGAGRGANHRAVPEGVVALGPCRRREAHQRDSEQPESDEFEHQRRLPFGDIVLWDKAGAKLSSSKAAEMSLPLPPIPLKNLATGVNKMNREAIEANARLIDARFPGLRQRNRYGWTHKVARLCYEQDQTVGQKRASPGRPVSEDTLGWSETPVFGASGDELAIPFTAVDLLNGTTGEIHWLEFQNLTDQIFVIPTETDTVGNGALAPTAPLPSPVALKPREQFLEELIEINHFYRRDEGLQRPGGMVLIDRAGVAVADIEALGAWGYDLMTGRTVEEIKKAIRRIPNGEWQAKHPGETP